MLLYPKLRALPDLPPHFWEDSFMRWQPIWSAPIFGRTAFRCLKPSISIGRSGAHNSFDMSMIDFWDQGWPETKPGSRKPSSGILHLWEAIQSLCGWLVGLAWTAVRPDKHKRTLSWSGLRTSFQAEVPLEAEFRMPEWSESVRLTGIADSLLRVPHTRNWCIQEYKIGRTSPEADLAQVCLYHLILSKNLPNKKAVKSQAPKRSLALISFQPEVHEKIFSEEELASAQEKLLALIGHLAGVVGSAPRPEGPHRVKQDEAMRDLCQKLLKVFDEYRRPVELAGEPIVGPAFFRFLMNLGHGVKLEQIQRLSREVQVRLGLRKPPFIGVDRGRVVLDIERPDRQTIRFEEVKGQLRPGDALAGSPLIPVGLIWIECSEPQT